MGKRRRRKRRMETSKLLLFTVLPFFSILEICVLIGWLAWDRADAAGLAGVFAVPIGTVIGFYTWKAKNENIQKYGFLANLPTDDEDEC